MTAIELGIAGLAGLGAGLINALAGGGTLLSFPALTALGVPAVAANITNTVALCPGYLGATYAQRRDLRGQGRRLVMMMSAGAVGGLAGALLLLATGEHAFRMLIPYLILVASLLLALQDPVRAWLARRAGAGASAARGERMAVLPVGVAAIYGGFFGAGLSVVVLAVLGLLLDETMTRLNALKQAIALSVNVTAAVFFLFSGRIVWPIAVVIACGALIGGSVGGRLAAAIRPSTLRRAVVAAGVVIAIVYFVK